MTKALQIRNLGCASCAAKMEKRIAQLAGVTSARVNFMTQRLTLEAPEGEMPAILEEAGRIIRKIEPDACLLVG